MTKYARVKSHLRVCQDINCGLDAVTEIGNRWYCAGHAKRRKAGREKAAEEIRNLSSRRRPWMKK